MVIVPKKGVETGLDEIPAFMRMLLGEEDIEVTVNLAESLPATPKNRTIVSKVPCPISAV